MRAHEDSLAILFERGYQVAHFAAANRIESAHWLVEKDDLRIVDECLSQADALKHAF